MKTYSKNRPRKAVKRGHNSVYEKLPGQFARSSSEGTCPGRQRNNNRANKNPKVTLVNVLNRKCP